jgi:malonyl-CoA/methylmalonyl-CoA synthetase
VSGSAPLLPETHLVWEKRTGHAILERYGMTETNMNASNPYIGPRKAGTVGLPLPGVEIRIADERGQAVAQGQAGMIQIRGPNVFKGYWNMPAKTAEEFTADGYFISGDLGEIDEDGYLVIVGRAKDLIISGGYNVYPKEVEIEIDLIPGVLESAVVGLPHPDFGEGVIAVVVPTTEGAVPEKEIIAALKGRLAAYKLPKKVFCVSELPRNTMGKVQKNLLRERYISEFRS